MGAIVKAIGRVLLQPPSDEWVSASRNRHQSERERLKVFAVVGAIGESRTQSRAVGGRLRVSECGLLVALLP
jgi:hypothetical protein